MIDQLSFLDPESSSALLNLPLLIFLDPAGFTGWNDGCMVKSNPGGASCSHASGSPPPAVEVTFVSFCCDCFALLF